MAVNYAELKTLSVFPAACIIKQMVKTEDDVTVKTVESNSGQQREEQINDEDK